MAGTNGIGGNCCCTAGPPAATLTVTVLEPCAVTPRENVPVTVTGPGGYSVSGVTGSGFTGFVISPKPPAGTYTVAFGPDPDSYWGAATTSGSISFVVSGTGNQFATGTLGLASGWACACCPAGRAPVRTDTLRLITPWGDVAITSAISSGAVGTSYGGCLIYSEPSTPSFLSGGTFMSVTGCSPASSGTVPLIFGLNFASACSLTCWRPMLFDGVTLRNRVYPETDCNPAGWGLSGASSSCPGYAFSTGSQTDGAADSVTCDGTGGFTATFTINGITFTATNL